MNVQTNLASRVVDRMFFLLDPQLVELVDWQSSAWPEPDVCTIYKLFNCPQILFPWNQNRITKEEGGNDPS